MKATDLLKKQHDVVDTLIARFEKSDDTDERDAIFEEIAANLVAHDGIEREIFYPACEEKMGLTSTLAEALVEHGLVEFMLFRGDQNRGDEQLEHYVTVLKEVVQHHVKEEENEFFPKVTKAFTAAELEELGSAMEARFEQALAADFRDPLTENLVQVVEGAMKTKLPKRPKPSARKASGKSNGRSTRASARA